MNLFSKALFGEGAGGGREGFKQRGQGGVKQRGAGAVLSMPVLEGWDAAGFGSGGVDGW